MAYDLQRVQVSLRMEPDMFKLVFTNLAITLVFPLSAFASDPVCTTYTAYVSKQCVSSKDLKGDMSAEMLRGYTVLGCRNDSYKMILESDVAANALCKPVMTGNLISSLE